MLPIRTIPFHNPAVALTHYIIKRRGRFAKSNENNKQIIYLKLKNQVTL